MSGFDFSHLFAVEGPRLRRFLRRFGPSVSADDIAQDSFVRLCSVDPRSIASPRAFLFRTARNLAIDQLRRRDAAPVRTVADLESLGAQTGVPSAEELLLAGERARRVSEALAALSEDQRQALVLRKVEGLAPDEIAARLGVSARHVQRLIAQAIGRCQAHLREDGDKSNARR